MKKSLIKLARILKDYTKELFFKPINRLTRHSSKTLVLKNLKKIGVPVSQIVDVGVSYSTKELMNIFPEREHLLFEPVSKHHSEIVRNYRKINHQLFPVALSDSKGICYLIESSIWGNGVSTHAEISSVPIATDGRKIINCKEIKVDTLDSYESLIKDDFILKIDVDGFDLNVLKGSENVIRKASIVIVEAHWEEFADRAKYIADQGFVLYDMADKCFYGEAIWQCDLVYVRNSYKEKLRSSMDIDFKYLSWHEL